MRKYFVNLTILALLSATVTARTAHAQVSDFAAARVSITFDDSVASTYNLALPILAARGLPATVFVVTGSVGKAGYLTWPQIQALQNNYGWEIGSHTVTHPDLAKLPAAKLKNEITNSLATLTSRGLTTTSFASPFGSYNNAALIGILKSYNLHRGFFEREVLNSYPYDRSVLSLKSIEAGITPQQVSAWIDQAKTEKKWLVLVLHEVAIAPDPNYEYTTTVADLTTIADYIKSSGIEVVLPKHSLQKPGQNLMTNSTFAQGITGGWTTDKPAQVKLDTGSNGSYPSPKESILFTGATAFAHLFSNLVGHNQGQAYAFQAFVNANALTAGSLNFYVDEYDAGGNWLFGKQIGWVGTKKVTYFSTLYTPSSSAVKSFKIQTYISGGAKGTVYVDNYELYGTTTVVPPVTNLVKNGSFETLTQGWADDWAKDSVSFTIDTATNGSDGPNSLQLAPNSAEAHVYSSRIAVSSGHNYTWKQYLKVISAGGEFGFYIDEYDAGGNWISGQWKGAVTAAFTGERAFAYTPTSSQVASVGLQYYAMQNSSLNLYLDSVSFSE